MQQSLRNLVSNALKYGSTNTRARVALGRACACTVHPLQVRRKNLGRSKVKPGFRIRVS
jgi:signal transduction histidine kinase